MRFFFLWFEMGGNREITEPGSKCYNEFNKPRFFFLQSLVITNDAVKIFRNYLILYTFQSVNEQVAHCVSLL